MKLNPFKRLLKQLAYYLCSEVGQEVFEAKKYS